MTFLATICGQQANAEYVKVHFGDSSSSTTSSFLEPILVTVCWVKKKGMRRVLQNQKCLLKTLIREREKNIAFQSRCMQNFHVRIKSKIERLIENNRSILHVVPVPFIRKEEKYVS